MATSGQTINDRLNAVRYALVGQGLARTVCKASTEEVLGPKRKHIEYLIACTNEPNVSIPQLANLLIERTQHSSWAVVFKSLISLHHLMSYGNDRFTQYLATSNHSFELADFMDRTTPQGYNMSTFVRRYAKYINEKSISYRTLAVDVCKVRSCKQLPLRTMNMDNLSKNMPPIEAQMDALLDFNATVKDLNNGIIKSAFRLLYKDLVRLYIAYQEAIINLMERFFKLNRKRTRDAYEFYKRFLKRMERLGEFLQLVDEIGLDKSEMPDLLNVPSSLLPALEHHLEEQEAKKRGGAAVSPELRGDDDEEADNKENEQATSPHDQPESPSTSTKDAPPASVADADPVIDKTDGQSRAGPSTGQAEPEKQAPPQKPARPSPKASPSKPEQPSAKPPAQPSQPSVPPKKAGPPERPAKPPSRPPPPSAAPPAVPVATASSTGPSNGPQASSGAGGRGEQSQAKVVAHTPPPPHPPPPHPAPPAHSTPHPPQPNQGASNENSSNNNSSTTNTANSNTNNNISSNNNNEPQGNGEESTTTTTNVPSTCSANVQHHEESESISQSSNANQTPGTNHTNEVMSSAAAGVIQEEDSNHVSNNNVRVEEPAPVEEMPPPPPPIDDDVEPPPPPPEPEQDVAPPEALEEPTENGQSNNGAD